MLKELWRKLGAEFLHSDGADGQRGDGLYPGGADVPHGVRLLPHITHTGEFHLERLTTLLRARYGKSFVVPDDTAASDHSLKQVISFAARTQDQDIQRELLLFYLNCSPVIQEYLRAETTLGQGPFFAG
jgi:hypothetical protein